MILVARYSQGIVNKQFCIDYRLSHEASMPGVYSAWVRKFESLGFEPLTKEVFEQMLPLLKEGKSYLSKVFSVHFVRFDT